MREAGLTYSVATMNMSLSSIVATHCPSVLRPALNRIENSPIGARLARGVFWSMAGAVISRGLMLVATICVARILGKTGYGELGMIQSTVGMFGTFAGFGLGLTATKHVAEFRQSDPERAGRIMSLSGMVAIVTGGLMALGLLIFAPWLASQTINAPHLAGPLRIGALILFISALNGAQTGALSGFEAFKTIAQVNLFTGLLSFPFLIAGAYWGGLTGAVWALALNLGFNWLFNHLAVRKEARRNHVPFTFQNCGKEWGVLWNFSLPVSMTSALTGPVMWTANAIMVNRPGGYGELGLYSAVQRLYLPVLFITSVISGVCLPILSNSYAMGTHNIFRKQAKIILQINGLILIFASCTFLALSPLLFHFYGKDYEYRIALVVFVTLSLMLSAFGGHINSLLIAMEIPWYGLLGNALWSIMYLSMYIHLAKHGATGMALALFLSLLFSQLFVEYHMLNKLMITKHNIFKAALFYPFKLTRSIYQKNRLQMSTTTAFFRNIDQLTTLSGEVPTPQRIYVFACSNGSEAYSLAMIYARQKHLDSIRIRGFDINNNCIDKARQAVYSINELDYTDRKLNKSELYSYINEFTIPNNHNSVRIADFIRSKCEFEVGNFLDPDFMAGLDPADIVVCQNVLIHMSKKDNQQALKSLSRLISNEGVLVIGGMRLNVRENFVKEIGLVPITTNCAQIHEGQVDLRRMWDRTLSLNRPYIAMPPFTREPGWEYRFSTMFRLKKP